MNRNCIVPNRVLLDVGDLGDFQRLDYFLERSSVGSIRVLASVIKECANEIIDSKCCFFQLIVRFSNLLIHHFFCNSMLEQISTYLIHVFMLNVFVILITDMLCSMQRNIK